MQALTFSCAGQATAALTPVGATDLVRLMDLQNVASGLAPVHHTHNPSDINDLSATVLALLATNGYTPGGVVTLVPNGGMASGVGGLYVDSGVVSLVGHHHVSSDINDLSATVLALLATNGYTPGGVVTLMPNGGLASGVQGLYVNSGIVSLVGHTHVAANIVDFTAALALNLPGLITNSATIVWNQTGSGVQALVQYDPAGALMVDGNGLAVNLGSGSTQAAPGNHTHSQLHNPLTVGTSSSLALNLSGQNLTAEVIVAPGGGMVLNSGGLALDFGFGATQVLPGNALAGLNLSSLLPFSTSSLTLYYNSGTNVLSGVVPVDPNPSYGRGMLGVSIAGLYVSLGSGVNQAAFGNHTHSVATETAAGFMAATDKQNLDTLVANAGSAASLTVASTTSMILGYSNFTLSGVVRLAPGTGYLQAPVSLGAQGLYIQMGTGANVPAAGNHTHSQYVPYAGGQMSGVLYLSQDPTTSTMAATKNYVDTSIAALNIAGYLPLSGGALSGTLTLYANPTASMQAAPKQYVDAQVATAVPLGGGTMSGVLTLSGNPTANLHAATKVYVDNSIGNLSSVYLSLGGGTMTGGLTLVGNPSTGLQATPKSYVDAYVTSLTNSITTINNTLSSLGATYLQLGGGTLTGALTISSGGLTVSSGALNVSAGNVALASGYGVTVNGVQVVGAQQPNIPQFTPAGGWSDSTAYSDFQNLVNAFNQLLTQLQTFGINAS